ncbi:RNA polymerase sigma factor [Sphingobacterium yanglingense]|uniref:RNA polymerase sigma-70 factor (ECF subfamily) n=1 Tax=Sphingobacterium yanglingense TaxID=1437280 RepID=A0A4R6WPG2_9SPHI|nr:RNA polymerase sigma-70 factor [Sphingobacterium yanglingense]TDQ80041.1 RNA polymerase sigma-70 factor (ECF subfamily) [Sphingobacterium yanglingense]
MALFSHHRVIEEESNSSFKSLFEQYAPRIYSFGFSYLKSVEDTEELVQDVFFRLWRQQQHLDESQNIKAYIFKIAVNLIYDQLRKRKLDKLVSELNSMGYSDEDDTTWNTLRCNELQDQIDALIMQLPEQRRLIFTMSRIEGMSYDEIANKLGLSVRTVENQIYRALSFLKKHIDSKYMLYLIFYYFS